MEMLIEALTILWMFVLAIVVCLVVGYFAGCGLAALMPSGFEKRRLRAEVASRNSDPAIKELVHCWHTKQRQIKADAKKAPCIGEGI